MYSKVYIIRNPGWEDCEFCDLFLLYGYGPLSMLSVWYRDLLFGLGMLSDISFLLLSDSLAHTSISVSWASLHMQLSVLRLTSTGVVYTNGWCMSLTSATTPR